MKPGILENIQKYTALFFSDKTHRYSSWDHCHNVFATDLNLELHTLNLAFYLASWGMYRGSSGLLQKNHLIHQKAVEIIYKPEYLQLKCSDYNEIDNTKVGAILDLKNELAKHYESITFKRSEKEPNINPTDTLISKILLGTFGCVPAYDRYFVDGIREYNKKQQGSTMPLSFNNKSLVALIEFANKNDTAIMECQDSIKTITQKHYPKLKIVDMYFWQIGYDKDVEEKAKKEQKKIAKKQALVSY